MNQYEIAVLYHPDLEVDLEKATSRVEKIFTDNGGDIKNTDNWGKRKLAYVIKGNESAIYIIYTVDLPPANVLKVESILNITDEVIRFLITKPDLKAIAKADAAKAEKARKNAERGDRDGDKEEESDDEPRERRSRREER
ncbi:MAG TPA: 30S ribosomal protein S6 [Candidatus Limnocylindrales bacterium]|nr:30S ribosomal protein S6 [Candidatus Limnocylindrales bacterium]